MKKFSYLVLTLVIILSFSLSACSGGTPASTSSAAPSSTTTAPTTTMSSADQEKQQQEEIERLTAEEVDRMRIEEEARLSALPKLYSMETGEYGILEFGGYEWRVLDIVDDRVLLLSDKILTDAICNEYFDTILVDGIPWEKWELREYLNGEFYNSFSSEDRARIVTVSNPNRVNYNNSISQGENTQDNIFLLSVEEVVQYFGGVYDVAANSVSGDSAYKANRVAHHVGGDFFSYDWENNRYNYSVKPGEAHTWLLRSPGSYTEGSTFVDGAGNLDTHGQPVTFSEGIRPAMWVRFESLAEIAERTIAVLPSANNEASRLSGGDTVTTKANTMELLLNSQSKMKLDASTNITIDKTDMFSIVLTVGNGAAVSDITSLRGDDRYQVMVSGITLNVQDAAFAIENGEVPNIIMLRGRGTVNGNTELSEGFAATMENGEVVVTEATVDTSTSTVVLEGIIANPNTLPSDFVNNALLLLNAANSNNNSSTDDAPKPTRPPAVEGFEIMTEKSEYVVNEEIRVRVRGVTSEMVGNGAFVAIYVRSYTDHTKYYRDTIAYPDEGETMLTITAPNSPGEYLVCLYSEDYTNPNPVLLASYPFRAAK